MATTIRLKRGGRTHAPYYRVVVMDSRSRSRGRELAILGYYHPCARPEPKVDIEESLALNWLAKGAQMSHTARSLLSKQGILQKYAECAKAQGEAAATDTVEA